MISINRKRSEYGQTREGGIGQIFPRTIMFIYTKQTFRYVETLAGNILVMAYKSPILSSGFTLRSLGTTMKASTNFPLLGITIALGGVLSARAGHGHEQTTVSTQTNIFSPTLPPPTATISTPCVGFEW